MDRGKNSVLLTVIAVATLLVAIVGASFAYFSATGNAVNQNVDTGVLKISAASTAVQESNIIPVDADDINTIDKKLGHADVAKLPVTVNTTDTTISSEYNIFLTTTGVKLNAGTTKNPLNGGDLEQLKWELVQITDDVKEVKASGNFKMAVGKTDGNFDKKQLNTAPINIPEGGSVDEYKVLIYIENTADAVQDQLQGLVIGATVSVDAKQK
ncbi:MAG: hypothetical protein E7166_05255 [Firmicutes bacterium]|nr:hypothetical protein [Bacillota bacterium]